MSNTSIDQLFQVTTTSTLNRTSQSVDTDANPFRAHLDRATDLGEAKPELEQRSSIPEQDGEPESTEANSHQEETAKEHEDSAVTPESAPPQVESTDEATPADHPADEVTLSVIVDTQVQHIASEIEPTLSTEVVVDTSNQHGQDPQSIPQSTPLAQTLTDPGNLPTAIQFNTNLPTTEADQATDDNAILPSDTESEVNSTSQSQRSEGRFPSSTPLLQKSQDPVQTTARPQVSANQQPTSPEQEATDDTREREHSPQTAQRAAVVPGATAKHELITETDGDLTLSSHHVKSPAAENTSIATPAPTSTENVASATRPLGSTQTTMMPDPTGSTAESQDTETSNLDRTRFVQRISGAIRSAQLRDGQIQLRLSPPELGTLRIQLTVNEGAVTAHLETDNGTARNVLLDNLPALRERLAEQEIRIEKFDVDVSRDGQQPADHSDTTERQANNDRTHANQAAETSGSDAAEAASPNPDSATNGLDVRI